MEAGVAVFIFPLIYGIICLQEINLERGVRDVKEDRGRRIWTCWKKS